MALEIKQTLRLTQQLVMTPQLQLAIKLLQLSRLELDQLVQQELLENPVLEAEVRSEEAEAPQPKAEAQQERPDLQDVESWWRNLSNLEEYFQPRSSVPRRALAQDEELDEDRLSWEDRITRSDTLADHLLWQLRLSDVKEEERHIASLIIGNLDDDGYLRASSEEIAEEAKAELDVVESVLKRVQEFDPPGVAARDLKECLIIQMRAVGIQNPAMERMVTDHLHALEKKDYESIARALSMPVSEVLTAAQVISRLEPKPGRPFSQTVAQYIVPDVFVFKVGDEYQTVLNEDGMPLLRINSFYRRCLDTGEGVGASEAKEYLQEKLRGALWLIRSIHQRQKTIYRVVESIVKFQREFFDKGVVHLKPMVLRDVAEDVGVHESTISRVTTNKYLQTPHGLYELKFFFSSGLKLSGGDSISSESVKEIIKGVIAGEERTQPYSDQALVELLRARNIKIARRTVTKYREMMGVLSSSRRKRLF